MSPTHQLPTHGLYLYRWSSLYPFGNDEKETRSEAR
jgi:hypothetical protein